MRRHLTFCGEARRDTHAEVARTAMLNAIKEPYHCNHESNGAEEGQEN
jgi:hypothetical protein